MKSGTLLIIKRDFCYALTKSIHITFHITFVTMMFGMCPQNGDKCGWWMTPDVDKPQKMILEVKECSNNMFLKILIKIFFISRF